MAKKVLFVLVFISFGFFSFTVGRYTNFLPFAAPGNVTARAAGDLSKLTGLEKTLALAIAASSGDIAKKMVANLDKGNITADAFNQLAKLVDKNAQAQGVKKPGMPQEDDSKVYEVPLGDAPVLGKENAPVTIVAFSEFQCPFCGRAFQTTKKLEEEYGNKIRIAFKSKLLPRHEKAPLAHAAAYAAGEQGKFWEMHDKIFSNQQDLSEETFLKYAKELKLNMSKFKKSLDPEKWRTKWDEDAAEAEKLGVSGTPTFFVNGKKIRGAQPYEVFKNAVDEALKGSKPQQ